MSTPAEISALLAELNQEFGKKPKYVSPNAEVRERNKAWHQANVPLEGGARGYAKAQLQQSEYRNFYDWESHRRLTIAESESLEPHGLPEMEWTPEARVTTVIRQYCGVCASCTEFVGNEYIRFRGRRRKWHELGGEIREMSPTVLRRAADCDPNLIMFGLPDGSILPDLTEEIEEKVTRCVGCIAVERQAWAMLEMVIQQDPQAELPGFNELLKEIK